MIVKFGKVSFFDVSEVWSYVQNLALGDVVFC